MKRTIQWCIGGVLFAEVVAIGAGLWPLVLFAGGLGAFIATVAVLNAVTSGPAAASPGVDFEVREAIDRWRARAEALVGWADGTAAEWDRHVRPILSREAQLALGRKSTGEYVFGQWWQWVDPLATGSGQSPGREGLEEILRRLEWITMGELT